MHTHLSLEVHDVALILQINFFIITSLYFNVCKLSYHQVVLLYSESEYAKQNSRSFAHFLRDTNLLIKQ